MILLHERRAEATASASSAAALPMVGDPGLEPVTCVAAAAQNALTVIRLGEEGLAPDLSGKTHPALTTGIVELPTWEDSHKGGAGPGGWSAVPERLGHDTNRQGAQVHRDLLDHGSRAGARPAAEAGGERPRPSRTLPR